MDVPRRDERIIKNEKKCFDVMKNPRSEILKPPKLIKLESPAFTYSVSNLTLLTSSSSIS